MSTEISSLLVSTPGVCGGRVRIDGTRVTVNDIVVLYQQGHSAEEIADEYSQLKLAQVYAALAYYHANRDEIEADLESEPKAPYDQGSKRIGTLEDDPWLDALKELQRRLNLTPVKAAEWQDTIREARR